MQANSNDTILNLEQPDDQNEQASEPTERKPVSPRLERIADEAALKGRARQERDEPDGTVIVHSDGHGTPGKANS